MTTEKPKTMEEHDDPIGIIANLAEEKPLNEKKHKVICMNGNNRYDYKEEDVAHKVNNVIKWASSGTRIIDGESVVNKMKEEFGDLK